LKYLDLQLYEFSCTCNSVYVYAYVCTYTHLYVLIHECDMAQAYNAFLSGALHVIRTIHSRRRSDCKYLDVQLYQFS